MMDLNKFGLDAYRGCTEYSTKENDDIIRNMIFDAIGEKLPEKKSKYRRWFKDNSNKMFAIIEELITEVSKDLGLEQFGDLVDVENFEEGDKKEFIIENTDLFKVSVIATGLKPSERQILHDTKVKTTAYPLGVKIYAELFDFVTGKINWTNFVDRVVKSFNKKECALATRTIFSAYDTVGNPNFCKATSASTLNEDLREMIAKVMDNTGEDVTIMGVKKAVSKIENVSTAQNADKDDRRNFGYVKLFEGTPVVELPNYYDKDLGKFEIDDDMILVVPAGTKILKMGVEGDVVIDEKLEGRADKQIEMEMEKMIHMGVAVASVFGMLKIS